jgi:hypothetical protein
LSTRSFVNIQLLPSSKVVKPREKQPLDGWQLDFHLIWMQVNRWHCREIKQYNQCHCREKMQVNRWPCREIMQVNQWHCREIMQDNQWHCREIKQVHQWLSREIKQFNQWHNYCLLRKLSNRGKNNLLMADNLIFTSYEGYNCFIIPKLLQDVYSLNVLFLS